MNLCTVLQNLLDLCTALLQNLLDDISGELGGNLMDLCTALFTPRWEYVAGWIDRAIQVGRFGGSHGYPVRWILREIQRIRSSHGISRRTHVLQDVEMSSQNDKSMRDLLPLYI